jgi:hypothetical protein
MQEKRQNMSDAKKITGQDMEDPFKQLKSLTEDNNNLTVEDMNKLMEEGRQLADNARDMFKCMSSPLSTEDRIYTLQSRVKVLELEVQELKQQMKKV